MSTIIYYEAHVTVELNLENLGPQVQAAHVTELAAPKGFKFASLTTVSRGREKLSHILTGHDKDRENLLERMVPMIKVLKLNGYKIERYKIEDISLDSRVADSFGLLG